MGFIPIILFTLAFIFLWGIVNYHSLRKTRNEIRQLQEKIIDIFQKRKDIATRLLSGLSIMEGDKKYIASITNIANSPLIHAENINQVLQNEASRTRLSSELNALSDMKKGGQHPKELIESLSDLTLQLAEIKPRIMDLLHNYDKMVSKPPSKFIARLFGF